MSRRPYDWSPLAGADPVPGDPDEVERIGSRYVETATALRDQAARLRALSSDRSWESEAGDEWRHQGRDVAEDLAKVVTRYDGAGRALRTYAGQLRGAQNLADRALDLAQEAERRARSAEDGLRETARQAASAPPETPPPDTSGLDRQSGQAAEDLSRARTMLREAESARDSAASAAAGAIDDITGSDGLNDGRFAGARKWVGDKVEWVDRNLKQISDIASKIAMVAGIAALAVGWIPVIGQIAAAVLTAVAALASLVALAGYLVMALQGRGSWTDVALAAVAVATLGVGRAALTGVKVADRGVRAAAQAGKTDELVAAAVAARGAAHVGGKALRRMTIAARRQAKATPGMGLTRNQVGTALAGGPRLAPSGVLRAMDPRVLAQEAATGTRELFRGQRWSEALQAVQSGGRAVNPFLDDAARMERSLVAQLPAQSLAAPAAAAYSRAAAAQYATLVGATTGPIAVDLGNDAGVFDGLKARTVTAPAR